MLCSLCHQDTSVEFLNLGDQPLANKYPTPDQFASEDFFPLSVYFCTNCKNVELGTKVSRERLFEDYYYLSSVNQGLVRHFNQMARELAQATFVIDIGSNDGILLKPLKELGVRCLGVEPSINVSKIANDAGLETLTSFFDAESVKKIEAEYGKPDVIVASSVFTHMEDPATCIDDACALLTDEGEFIIEVEYIGNMIRDVQFERFYLDRIFYYSVTSLDRLFRAHGMYLSDVTEVEPHGGSMRVTAKKIGHGNQSDRVADKLREEETTLTLERVQAFSTTVNSYLSDFKKKLEEYQASGVRVAGYSAPARVSTICNYGHIGPELIEFIVDDSPLKQHRYSPGTHIPIVPKEHLEAHHPDLLVVFAYEYLEDIRKKTGNAYRYLIPIPPREVM